MKGNFYEADEKVSGIFAKYSAIISKEVLALAVVDNMNDAEVKEIYQKEWNINGEHVLLGVKKGGN